MNEVPLHTARLVGKLLAEYCSRVCPPTARNAVQLGFQIGEDRATVMEVRRFCGVPGAHSHVPLAQFRYSRSAGAWRLYYADRRLRWRRYPVEHCDGSFLSLLREFDTDAAGRFWCRVNGKSLRWCSAHGRCNGCDERYCRILGLEPRPEAAVEPLRLRGVGSAR
jgi:hypothetical protein